MKIGDKVVALNDFRMDLRHEIALIKGKTYKIKGIDAGFIIIDSEYGKDHRFSPSHFHTIKEIRRKKLNELNQHDTLL